MSEAGIALEVELEEHLHYATDPELWERLLQNMLSNVLKHGKDQARLTLMSDADTIRVELRNIVQQPIQHLDQLASRFYSENLSDTEESSGLGLYIIQNFVEILGGDLQLATEADWFILTITLRKKAWALLKPLDVDKLLFYIKTARYFSKKNFIYSHLRKFKTFRCEKSAWNTIVSGTREFWGLRLKTKSWNFFEVRWRPYSPMESF